MNDISKCRDGIYHKKGEVREDGMIFRGYSKSRITKDGFYYEMWANPESYKIREARRYAREKERKQEDKNNPEKMKLQRERWKGYSKTQREKNPERIMLTAAKRRAQDKNIEINIELEDIVIPEFCPVFGIPLIRGSASDNSPELDRINVNKGYVKGNVIVVSRKANWFKSTMTLPEIQRLAEFYSQFS